MLGACDARSDGPMGNLSVCEEPTYECVAPLIASRCTWCHSSALAQGERSSAPVGVDFDTEADLARWKDQILARAVMEGTMPPGAPLPAEERQLLERYLATVTGSCVPSCASRACGDDGCGGVCGTCGASERCTPDGLCECVPDCSGRQCGDDGCGGSCGGCAGGLTCVSGACECVPDCFGRQCGGDGCGGSCGTCPGMLLCNTLSGQCGSTCTPDDCATRMCGDDGCGGSCGTCPGGQACSRDGQCECAPTCGTAECGDDGCGGICGTCVGGQACVAGTCEWQQVSFANDVMPLFAGCAGNSCHGGVRPQAELDLSSAGVAWADLVNVPASECGSRLRVAPGDASGSYLVAKLTGVGMCSGSVMPKGDPPLSSSEIELIRAWIGTGAQND